MIEVPRAILHVDMDAFYASVEQRDRPELKGLPVIVGGTGARGVVAAASYEVRKFGVHSAMPMREALQRCPHAVCIAPRMRHYQEVSRQIFAVFHEFTPLVEGLSLDEAFLDVTASLQLFGTADAIAAGIKQRIRASIGLTASVGIATNKLLAKIASDLRKPDGLVWIRPEEVGATLDPLPVRRLNGVGRKTGERLEACGIATFGDLRRAADAVLWPVFGRYTQKMRERAAGIDERPVVADGQEKSISAEETYDRDLHDPQHMLLELASLADRTCARLRASQLVAGEVHVKIRRGDFTTYARQHSISPPTQDTRLICEVAQQLLKEWLRGQPHAQVRLLGVGVGALAAASQFDLFAPAGQAHRSPLDEAVDRIRERFGDRSLTRANLRS